MVPLKVSMLSEKISTVYLEVSNKFILPAQRHVQDVFSQDFETNFDCRSVGGMMEFSDDTSEEGRKKLQGKGCRGHMGFAFELTSDSFAREEAASVGEAVKRS
jgi:hypothetical protein